jgi:hypothetical protein
MDKATKEWHLGHVPGTVIVDKDELDALRAEVTRWNIATTSERERGDRAVARAVKAEAEVERLQAKVAELTQILDSHRAFPSDGGLPRWSCQT